MIESSRGALAPFIDFAIMVFSLTIGVVLLNGICSLTDIGWLDRDTFTIYLSMACPLLTMVQFVSPAPLVIEAIQLLNVQNLPTQVFQSQIICNVLGGAYGLQITNMAVLATNMFGLACQILWLAGDHFVRCSDTSWVWFSIKMSTMLNIGFYVAAVVMPIELLGHCITIFNIVLFAAPLSKLGNILRTRNASSLPTTMTVITTVTNAVWILYATMIQDDVVLIPSVLGYLLSAFQIQLIMWSHHLLPFDLGFLLLCVRSSKSTLDACCVSAGACKVAGGIDDTPRASNSKVRKVLEKELKQCSPRISPSSIECMPRREDNHVQVTRLGLAAKPD